jgi:hypothetical protein
MPTEFPDGGAGVGASGRPVRRGFAGSLLVSVRWERYLCEHMFDGGLAG